MTFSLRCSLASQIESWSIRRKLAMVVSATAFLALSAVFVVVLSAQWMQHKEEIEESLISLADIVGTNSQAAVEFEDRKAAAEIVGGLKVKSSIVAACLATVNGQVLAEFHAAGLAPLCRSAEANKKALQWDVSSAMVVRQIRLNGKRIGSIAVKSSLDDFRRRLTFVVFSMVAAMLLSLAGAVFLARLLVGIVVRPVSMLTDAARAISRVKDYRNRVSVISRDELGQLTQAFNSMMDEIELRDKQLELARGGLEQTVAARTAALVQMNEQLLLSKEKAEESTRLKSEFLANMSHELRTPMNAVIGMTELALGTELNEEQRSYLTAVSSSAESLLGIISDVLDFSKVEAGKLDLEQVTFDLRKATWETLNSLRVRADEKGLDLLCDIDGDVPETVVGDPGRLRQVMVNLVGNAIKFTADGEIAIRAALDSVGPGGPVIHFTVSDTGIGIPAEAQEKIFAAFTQADGSTTRKYGGTGLGLAICRQLIELMGGRIWVESEPERGSTFHFTVKFNVTAAALLATPAPTVLLDSSRKRGIVRILLAEDNRVNQKLAVTLLRKRGYTVEVANDGREALAKWKEGAFDVILMDIQMPEMGGLEATAAIRKEEAARGMHTPVIAMTAHAMKGDRERFLSSGMDGYVAKPVKPAVLYDAIEKALGSTARLEEEHLQPI